MDEELIYTPGGNHLNRAILNGNSFHPEKIYETDSTTVIQTITRVDSDRVIFDESNMTGESTLKHFDLTSGTTRTITTGNHPVYAPDRNKLLFYRNENGHLDWYLLEGLSFDESSSGGVESTSLDLSSRKENHPRTVLVTNDLIVLGSPAEGIYSVNLKKESVEEISFPDVWPLEIRKRTNQWLCQDQDRQTFLWDRDEEKRHDLPELNQTYGHIYRDSVDQLVFGRTESDDPVSEGYNIYCYNFDSGEKFHLHDGHLMDGVIL
jgi:hypothetical protein